ncbi:protein kinase [Streptomyces sp. NPDC059582]|uniref:protein kinase domain-containing protein n=1 Tax=Streptomyces sp. NPDC059582 TaxID=3346875 RepID=UPI0036CE14AA
MEMLGPGDPPRIGGYRLLARLGSGGMGHVYLARSDRGRTVAVKLVRRELAEREEFRARFRQEVRAARRVGGYWTAPVLDADTEAPVPWVATGYVAGPSLQQVVGHDHGALPERSVRILAAGLAHALVDIHSAGIVHRDLKPSNVLVTLDGPRVIDFGIARAMETMAESGLTSTGSLVGSPGFMAPEQVRGDRVTPACDVFCLGSVLAYAATGTLPFGSADSGVHALMFRIAQEEPDLTGVPEGIADLVRDCLRKDPAARPSLGALLARTGAQDTVSGGRSRDPWLPGVLVAQLGRHAVRLLDTENPTGPTGPVDRAGSAGPEGPADRVRPEGRVDRAGPAGRVGSADPTGPAGPAGPVDRSKPVEPVDAEGPRRAVHAQEAVPEHASAADDVSPSDAGPGQLPTSAVTPANPSAPAPAHPSYGHPQQHPHPHPAYGYPGHGTPTGVPAPYNPYGDPGGTPPYGPPPGGSTLLHPSGLPEEPRRPNGRSTVFLVLIALVVALAAGGSVYALMSGAGRPGASPTAPSTGGAQTSPDATTPEPSRPEPSGSGSSTAVPGDGAVPEGYVGTWAATIDGANTRRLTIRQGEVGEALLTLIADGPAGTGVYHCEFTARLTRKPAAQGPLEIGPSTVTSGEPRSSCSPGGATRVTLLPGGGLERVNTSTGEQLTYVRQ